MLTTEKSMPLNHLRINTSYSIHLRTLRKIKYKSFIIHAKVEDSDAFIQQNKGWFFSTKLQRVFAYLPGAEVGESTSVTFKPIERLQLDGVKVSVWADPSESLDSLTDEFFVGNIANGSYTYEILRLIES